MPTPAERLATHLGADAIDHGDGLTDGAVDRLIELVDAQRSHQHDELSAAIDRGLRVIPRALRGPVKRLVFGR